MAYAKNQSLYAVKTCRVCGDRLYDEQHLACGVCRVTAALRLWNWRAEQTRRKLCVYCVDSSHYDTGAMALRKSCRHHLQYQNEYQQRRYHARRAKGLCVRCGVNRTARVGSLGVPSPFGYAREAHCEGCK